MPTILRQQGFRVIIYLNDHLPSHVHVLKGNGEVRIDLGNEGAAPTGFWTIQNYSLANIE